MPNATRPTLVIGNKNYSSWSLRPWLLLRHHGVDFGMRRNKFKCFRATKYFGGKVLLLQLPLKLLS